MEPTEVPDNNTVSPARYLGWVEGERMMELSVQALDVRYNKQSEKFWMGIERFCTDLDASWSEGHY